MKLFNGILGVFAAFAAMFCFLYPGRTFLNAGWMVTMLLLCWGLCAMFESFHNKTDTKPGKDITARGIVAVVAGLLAASASVLSLVSPKLKIAMDMLIVCVFLFWILASGITAIIRALVVVKKQEGKKWVYVLVLGVLTLLIGLYGVYHAFLTAWAMTLMFGIVLLGYSIRLLASIFE